SAEGRELRALERDLANKKTELAVIERELARKKQTVTTTPAVSRAQASALSAGAGSASSPIGDIGAGTDTNRLGNRYAYLLHRQDDLRAERALSAGLDPGIFQIVDRPAVPQSPAGPDRPKLMLIGTLMAVALALLVVGAVQARRLFEVRSYRDVEYY